MWEAGRVGGKERKEVLQMALIKCCLDKSVMQQDPPGLNDP